MQNYRLSGLVAAAALAGASPAALAANQTPTVTQPVTNYPLPYGLNLATSNFGATPMPTLQSFASGEQNGLWVMIGGRSNGLHGFSGSGLINFPVAFQSRDVWVVDPVTKQSWSRSLEGSGLPTPVIDLLTAANYEETEVGGKLYMIGGYGFDRTQNKFVTYDTLTSVDLNGLIAWAKSDPAAPALTSIFRTIHDPALQVTGGEMTLLNGKAMLVFGQNFDGDYTPGANGNYTNQVRSFTITDTATSLSIGAVASSPNPGDPSQYRRRDFTMVDVMHQDPVTRALTPGLVQFAGVFTTSGGGWTVPVEVGPDGVPHEADPAAAGTFKQGLNVYTAARFASFSRVTGANYDTLFGGISAGTFDTATNTFTPDTALPFNNVITTIVIDKNGNYTQDVMSTAFPTILSATNGQPLLFGANAHFFLADGIPTFTGSEVIDLDAVMANATSNTIALGYIFGGISADQPNFGKTAASNLVFNVTMALPALVDLNAAGTTTAGAGTMARRLVVENAGAQYNIPTGVVVTAYGGTTVTAGQLIVNGTLATRALSIAVGGTVRGTGTVDAPATVAGTLRPGNSPGTLTFTQSVVQSATGTLMLDIDGTGTASGAGNYARVVVTGIGSYTAGGSVAPVLRGITGSANNTFTPALGQRFTVVTAAGGVSGNFASVVQPSAGLAAGTRFDVSYAASSIDLFVTPASFADLSALGGVVTHNRAAVGGALDILRGPAGPTLTGDTATVINALYGLPASAMGAALDQMAGTVHGDAMTAALSANRMFAFTDGNWDGGPTMTASLIGNTGQGFAAINELAAPQPASLSGSPFWARAAGQWINATSDGSAPGYTANAGGAIAGFDLVRDADARFGFAGAYTVSDVTNKVGATANVQGGRVFAYGSKITGAWRFDHEVSLGFDGYHTRRPIVIGGLTRIATGKADGFNVSADLAAHYDLGFAVPFGEFRYDRIHRDGFTETGAGVISLAVAGADLDAPRLLAGADFDLMRTFGQPSPDCVINLRLAWAHDFDGTFGVTDSALTGAPAARFAVFSSKPGNDAGLLDLRASTSIGDGFGIFGAYSLEARDREITQGVSLGLRATW